LKRPEKPLIDEWRLYRRIPILKRLVPSASKRITRLLWPNGRVVSVHQVRLVGLSTPVIHIFGDSHCGLFAKTPGATMHYVGPVTMHRVGRDGLRAFALNTLDIGAIRRGDALGFIFGEIDVRVHIAKQRDRYGRPPTEIIDTLAAAHMSTLEAMRAIFPASPIVVFSVIPPAGNKYPHFNSDMPRNGTDQERIAWSLLLNETLKHGAFARGFRFLDQYSPFANKRGLLNLKMSRDAAHVTPESIKRDIELDCTWREA
jgi:hypothetical protein